MVIFFSKYTENSDFTRTVDNLIDLALEAKRESSVKQPKINTTASLVAVISSK